MERATLARPYAEALAKLAGESRSWGLWSERLALLALVVGDAQVQSLATNPGVPGARVAEIILAVCGEQLGAEGGNLTSLLAENKRLAFLPEIVSLFEALKADQEGELTAHVTSAFPLSAGQMAGLVAKLEAKFGRKVTADQSVDSELIGGVVIQVGDEVMDASVRGGLEALAVTLKA
ncbi:MAG: F0F1 ATP synthase subunit delta [Pseudomonadota bacterium]|nr:F0F1 ATP synthase subunit delta [Pseudomonadota bacterium]